MTERRASESANLCEKGHVLLGAIMLIFLLGTVGMTSLYLAGQDGSGISATADTNTDVVVAVVPVSSSRTVMVTRNVPLTV